MIDGTRKEIINGARNGHTQYEIIVLREGMNLDDVWSKLDDKGVKGYAGLENIPIWFSSKKRAGDSKFRHTFMGFSEGLRLMYPTPLSDIKKSNPNLEWELYQFWLEHPGGESGGGIQVPAVDEYAPIWTDRWRQGWCYTCSLKEKNKPISERHPDCKFGNFPLPRCPICKGDLTRDRWTKLGMAIEKALGKSKIELGEDNWRDYECRISVQQSGKTPFEVEFVRWGSIPPRAVPTDAVPTNPMVKHKELEETVARGKDLAAAIASGTNPALPPVEVAPKPDPMFSERLQAFIDERKKNVIAVKDKRARSKMVGVYKTLGEEMDPPLSDDEASELWDKRRLWMK